MTVQSAIFKKNKIIWTKVLCTAKYSKWFIVIVQSLWDEISDSTEWKLEGSQVKVKY